MTTAQMAALSVVEALGEPGDGLWSLPPAATANALSVSSVASG